MLKTAIRYLWILLNRKIDLEVSQEEINKRKKTQKLLVSKVKTGYLYRYSQMVTSASTGAVFNS